MGRRFLSLTTALRLRVEVAASRPRVQRVQKVQKIQRVQRVAVAASPQYIAASRQFLASFLRKEVSPEATEDRSVFFGALSLGKR